MDISFSCNKCGQSLTIDEAGAGQLIDCPKCGTALEVPFRFNTSPKTIVPSPAKRQPKQSSPLLVTVVVVLGLLCTGLVALIVVLVHSKSPSSAAAIPVTRILDKILPDMTLDGEVFIVTKGGDNVKLGLVPIGLISLDDLMPYNCVTSEEVLREASLGDATMGRRRLEALAGIPVSLVEDAARELARRLLVEKILPMSAASDAIHVAVSSLNNVNFLLTWNCRHLANPHLLGRLREFMTRRGLSLPEICTPVELVGD